MSQNSKKKTAIDRREFLLRSLASGGALGLRSFLLGLPISFLTRRSIAAAGPANYLIYSTQSMGCPVNNNAPGTYESNLPYMYHPSAFATPATFNLGTNVVKGAAPWATLQTELLNRMQFIYHDTLTNSHNEGEKVMQMQGSLKGSQGNGEELIPSAIAQLTSGALGTFGKDPIVIADTNSKISSNSVPLQILPPNSIKNLFSNNAAGAALTMKSFRDSAVDELYRDLKTNGNLAQRKFLDNHVQSAQQSRNLASALSNSLSAINGNTYNDQALTAAALLAAGITPSVVLSFGFGQDNHLQSNPDFEVTQTNESILALNALYTQLKALGIHDKTTFCLQNVFGRTFGPKSPAQGRDHYGAGSVAVMFGPNIKPGITGGLEPINSQFGAKSTGINSTTGKSSSPDIPVNETLASVGKTLMYACGIAETDISRVFDTKGKIIRSVVS